MRQLRYQTQQGFTLIEILVVVIILGVMAAIALPQLLNQVAKGRQAEAKNTLGIINRAQQAYRFETGTFGLINDADDEATIPVRVSGKFYTFSNTYSDTTFASHEAIAEAEYDNDIKDYASGVAQDEAGNFSSGICEAGAPADPVGDVGGDGTTGITCDEPTSVLIN